MNARRYISLTIRDKKLTITPTYRNAEKPEISSLRSISVRFQIPEFLNIYMDFLSDFLEGVRDFRALGWFVVELTI